MIVMMIAITPSLNASSLPFVTSAYAAEGRSGETSPKPKAES
jgi:hypothetical protein